MLDDQPAIKHLLVSTIPICVEPGRGHTKHVRPGRRAGVMMEALRPDLAACHHSTRAPVESLVDQAWNEGLVEVHLEHEQSVIAGASELINDHVT